MRRGVELLLMDEEEFRGIVAEAVDALPARFRREVGATVEFVVEHEIQREHMGFRVRVPEDSPEYRILRGRGWPEGTPAFRSVEDRDLYPSGAFELYGLYSGHTLLERVRSPLLPRPPSVITIFMGPVMRANVDEDAVRFQVRNLVEHEWGITSA